jgi:DNA helicase II / ATP-dependent DNA helicase PcrA
MLKTKGFPFPIGSKNKKILTSDISISESTIQLVNDNDFDEPFFRNLESRGILLNEAQLAAVRSIKGPQLIIAGAGSGKTRVLATRTSYILTHDKQVRANQILLLTFTRKAANEMIERISTLKISSDQNPASIVAGTFHSVFLKMLRSNGVNKRILSSQKMQEIMIKRILKENRLKDAYEPETILSIISGWKSKMLGPDDVKGESKILKEVVAVYKRYEEEKEKNEYIDFDDILLLTYNLLKNDSNYRMKMQNHFKYICIDEYQDTNEIQHQLIKMLVNPKENNIFIVGDEDQVLYEFRNASPRYILNLEKDYPGLNRITLETNYRSNSNIVGLCNKLISFNKNRLGKQSKSTFNSENRPVYLRPNNTEEEATWIVENILRETSEGNRNYSDFSILYRTHAVSRAITDELVYRNIPYIIHGNDQVFYKNPIVKPLLAHLRLSSDPDDSQSIEDIAPTLFLRKDIVQSLLENATFMDNQSLLKSLHAIPGIKSFQQGKISNRIREIESLSKIKPMEALKKLREEFYQEYLEMDERKNLTLNQEFLQETLDELESSAERFNTIDDYLLFIETIIRRKKEMKNLKQDPDADAVNLMTIHTSKGLEFKCVHIIGFSESIIPHSSIETASTQNDRPKEDSNNKQIAALEEERRLAFVACSRAQEELYISSPKIYRGKDREVSRFLIEAYQ